MLSPRTLREAVDALGSQSRRAVVLAGGTELMVSRILPEADRVINIWGISQLRGISVEGTELRVGSLTTCAQLTASAQVRMCSPLLAAAAGGVGSVQVRNRATIGGNLGSGSPAADLAVVLVAMGARVSLHSAEGSRVALVEDYLTDLRVANVGTLPIIDAVVVPKALQTFSVFRKVGGRTGISVAKVSIAISLLIDDGRVLACRAAAGSVADRVIRLLCFEAAIVGRRISPASIRDASYVAAFEDAKPVSDLRSTRDYRLYVLRHMLERALLDSVETESRTHPSTRGGFVTTDPAVLE